MRTLSIVFFCRENVCVLTRSKYRNTFRKSWREQAQPIYFNVSLQIIGRIKILNGRLRAPLRVCFFFLNFHTSTLVSLSLSSKDLFADEGHTKFIVIRQAGLSRFIIAAVTHYYYNAVCADLLCPSIHSWKTPTALSLWLLFFIILLSAAAASNNIISYFFSLGN